MMHKQIKRWLLTIKQHPSALLLSLQLLSVLVYPFLNDSDIARVVLTSLGSVGVLLAVWVVNKSPVVNWVAWLLALPAILLMLLSNQFAFHQLTPWAHLLESMLYFYTVFGLISYMLNDDTVTIDELYAVGATFTLMAWAFAYLYIVCELLWPDSFIASIHPETARSWMEILYYSFTVLSSTGLSDIMPVGNQARAISMIEMMAGLMYMALIVSRLVGLSSIHKKN